MKRFFAIFIIAVLPAVSLAEGRWAVQQSGTLSWLRAVYFADASHGWAGGGSGTLVSTLDGGSTWSKQKQPTDDSIRDIHFSDQSHGWLLCDRDEFKLKSDTDSRSYLLRTEDGGIKWERVEIAANEGRVRFARLYFSPDGDAWLLGESGTLFRSTDHGLSWTLQPLPAHSLLLSAEFLNENEAWLVGAASTVFHTTNAGHEWRGIVLKLNGSAKTRLTAAAFPDSKFGWLVGEGGTIFATVDGGRSWQQQGSPVNSDFKDVRFIDPSEGWIAGSDGTILHTINGGTTWNVEQTNTTHPLERLFTIAPGNVWAVGFGGTILKLDQSLSARPVLKE